MKIIRISNYGDESMSEGLVAEKVNRTYLKEILEFLNRDPDGIYFFKAVKDNHILYKFQP